MKNLLSDGHVINVPAPTGGCVSGEFTLLQDMFGAFVTTAAEGELVGFRRVGRFGEVPFEGAAVALGKKLYWKSDTSSVTGAATGNTFVGFAASASADGVVDLVLAGS